MLCRTLQMSFNVDPGVRYFSVGPTISARASAKRAGEKSAVNAIREWEKFKVGTF